MINAEIRIIVDGHEVSQDSFAQCVVREVRTAVREEIRQNLGNHQNRSDHSNQAANRETPRQAVSIRGGGSLAQHFTSNGGQVRRIEGHPHF